MKTPPPRDLLVSCITISHLSKCLLKRSHVWFKVGLINGNYHSGDNHLAGAPITAHLSPYWTLGIWRRRLWCRRWVPVRSSTWTTVPTSRRTDIHSQALRVLLETEPEPPCHGTAHSGAKLGLSKLHIFQLIISTLMQIWRTRRGFKLGYTGINLNGLLVDDFNYRQH